MTAVELANILDELEKHPRIAEIAIGDLRVTFRDAAPQPEAPLEEPEAEPEDLELPDGVFDPRKAIARVYNKDRERRGKAD